MAKNRHKVKFKSFIILQLNSKSNVGANFKSDQKETCCLTFLTLDDLSKSNINQKQYGKIRLYKFKIWPEDRINCGESQL